MKFLSFFLVVLLQFGAYGAEPEKVSMPNPSQLRASWWNYFKVPPDQFGTRADTAIRYFEGLKGEVPEESEALPLIDRIIANLEVLKRPVGLELVAKEKEESFPAHFSLGALESLAGRSYEEQKKFDLKRFQIDLTKENSESDQEHLDRMMAAYLPLSLSQKKFLKGLQIIALRLEIEMERRQIKVLTFQKQVIEGELARLEKEIDYAREHLQFAPERQAELEGEVKRLKGKLAESSRNVDRLQATLASTAQLLEAMVAEKLGLVELVGAQVQLALVKLGLGEKSDIKALYQKIGEWKEILADVQREKSDWEKGAFIELQGSLSAGSSDLFRETLLQLQQFEKTLFVADFFLDQLSLLVKEHYASFGDRVADIWYSTVLFFKSNVRWLERSLFKIGDTPFTLLGLFKFLLIFFIFYLVARFARGWIRKYGQKRKHVSESAVYTLSRLVFYTGIALGLIVATSTLGIDFTAFAFIAGALTVGIGFGLQSIVSNFVSGIILLVEKSIKPGDVIKLDSGDMGHVVEINVRTTLLRTFDDLELLVPNSELVGKKFTNWTLSDKIRRLKVRFAVAAGTDKEKLKNILFEAVKKLSTTLSTKEPDLHLITIKESSLEFDLAVWIDSPSVDAESNYLWVVESALRESGIQTK